MIAVVQRVSRAAVRVEGATLTSIGPGALVLLGVLRGDAQPQAVRLAERVAHLRMFADERQRMNHSALEQRREILVVSQFTLAADARRGRRPSFDRAAVPELAEPLCERFVAALRELGLTVATGRFGARMGVELENDGPVTFVLEEHGPP